MLRKEMGQRHWQPPANLSNHSTRFYPSREQLFDDLYFDRHASPYGDLKPYTGSEARRVLSEYPSSAQRHSGLILNRVKSSLSRRPQLIVEVGSFIGSGAVHVWGKLAREKSMDWPTAWRRQSETTQTVDSSRPIVLCVDPWQGDLLMRLERGPGAVFQKFGHMRGRVFPELGTTFMRRILTQGLSDTIYPLPLPSLTAARLLYLLGYKVDVIYLDSAHERGETAAEFFLWYQLLRPGGVILGDDFSGFPAVRKDVSLAASCFGAHIDIFAGNQNQWIIRKPDSN